MAKTLLLSLLVAVGSLPTTLFSAQKDPVPHWIWASDGKSPAAFFRKEIQAPTDLRRAIITIAGDDGAQVWVNDQLITRGGGSWGTLTTEVITSRLRAGKKNLIAVQGNNAKDKAGIIARIRLESADGKKTVVVTDASWRVSSKAKQGWRAAGFKGQKDWLAAAVLTPAGHAERPKPTLKEMTTVQLRTPEATAVERIRVPEGFKVELLYSVPKDDQGSWVAMTIDGKGRLIVSDQYGALYRVKTPAAGKTVQPSDVEKLPVDLGGAQGLLWAHDSLFAVLNTKEHGGHGLYRVFDTNGDDNLDRVVQLKKFEQKGGEHGPHAVLLGPDKESIYVVCGNQTTLPEGAKSLVPPVWGEDQILPRAYGRGFMRGVEAPRGWVAKTDKDGKDWEIICTGFRNEYDAAFNREGELFSFDADMEWDLNMPWYRPTRVNHIISGAEFGWRNGSGKFPEYYSDSFGAVTDIGPGSPTGVTFGYGAKFPAKYQDAFYICDWSYGKMYAVHLKPHGATYTAEFEEFMAAQPLPLTDLEIHPDGSMYVAIGGRRVQSGLYRITYAGKESTAPSNGISGGEKERQLRHELEQYHGVQTPEAIVQSWRHLGSNDRAVRYAARVALEHQPLESWYGLALLESDPQTQLAALIALARVSIGKPEMLDHLLTALQSLDYKQLSKQQRLDLIRAYALTVIRHGGGYPNKLTSEQRNAVIAHLEPHFPAQTAEENTELSQLLANLNAITLPKKGVEALLNAASQQEQISIAKNLRFTKVGWTTELRKRYFEWFVLAQTYRGGAAFSKFIDGMKADAIAQLSPQDKVALKSVLEKKADPSKPQFSMKKLEFVKNYKVEDFDDVIHVGLEGNRNFANGRNVFASASCYACHRFQQNGGAIGPDLTSAGGKFSPRDLLESIIEPSKAISDQYGAKIFEMNDGSTIVGRVMNLSGDTIQVTTNMFDPSATSPVDRKKLKSIKESPASMMPPGLINSFSKDDVLDMLAYLISGGDPENPMFK